MGNGKSIGKILTVVSIVVTLCVFAVTGVSGYTLAASLVESLRGLFEEPPEGEGQLGMQMTIDPTGGVNLILPFTVQNPGLMEVNVTLNIMLLSVDGRVIAEGSDSKRIPSRSSDELVVGLHVSPEDAAMFETSPPVLHLVFECRTFFDLVGIAVSAEIGAEALPPGL